MGVNIFNVVFWNYWYSCVLYEVFIDYVIRDR